MAVLCENLRLLFVMAPRTGCTSIGQLLCEEFGGRFVPREPILGSNGMRLVGPKHSTLKQLLEFQILEDTAAKQLYKFTAVRNPFDSLVSLYFKKQSKYQPLLQDPDSWIHTVPGYVDDMNFCQAHSFEEWLIRRYERPYFRFWRKGRSKRLYRSFVDGADFVMRFENLQDDFRTALRKAGVSDDASIPHVNRTTERNRDYRSHYSPRARRIVEHAFHEELEDFDYRF